MKLKYEMKMMIVYIYLIIFRYYTLIVMPTTFSTLISIEASWGYEETPFEVNFVLTFLIVGSISELQVSEVMPIQLLESLRASIINLCSVSNSLISKGSRTRVNPSPHDSIFYCYPKIPFLTLALIG